MGGRSVGFDNVLVQERTDLRKGEQWKSAQQTVRRALPKPSVRARIKGAILAGYERRLLPRSVAQFLINVSRLWEA